MPKVKRADPPFIQIASAIRDDIAAGKLAEGEQIPSARQIAASWGVALATAAKVLATLGSWGLVHAMPGVGTIVSPAGAGFGGGDRLVATRTSGRIYQTDERAEIISAALVPAPGTVADALGVAPGADVVRRDRLTRRGTQVVSASVSWLPGRFALIAPRLLETSRILSGTFAYVQECTGVAITNGRELTAAAAATAEQAETFGIQVGAPVLLERVTYRTQDGVVVEYGEAARLAGRWSSHTFNIG